MSVRRYFDTWCDVQGRGCKEWADGATSFRSITDARRRAALLGWVRKGRKDVCPVCAAVPEERE